MKSVFHGLFALMLLLLGGCIDGEEEVFIGQDGSARVKAVYRVPGVIFSARDAEDLRVSIEQEVGSAKNLKLITNKVEKENGDRLIILEIETDDVTALEGALSEHDPRVEPSKADKILHAIVGRFKIKTEGLSAKLTRNVNLGPLLEDFTGENRASMLGESEFRYTVHLPLAATESNAHQVINEGRTLKWTHKLIECRTKPITLTMATPIPIPWWVYLAALLLLVAVLWLLNVLWQRARRKKRRSAVAHEP